jgi:hypothetical protein
MRISFATPCAAAKSCKEARMFEKTGELLVSRRVQVYGIVCTGIFFFAVLTGFWSGHRSGVTFNNVRGDGRFYFAYLPSLIIDGDLDFENQIREHWDVAFQPELLNNRAPTGLIRNKYPIGLALTLLPAFFVGHALALTGSGGIPADGYSWPYQVACQGWIAFLLWRALGRIDRIMTAALSVPPGPTLLGLVVLVLATPCGYYAWREPFMVHIASLFWCTEVAAAATNPSPQPRSFWAWLAFSAGMAIVCRPTNVFMLPVLVYGVNRLLRREGGSRSLAWLPLASVGLVPIGLQLVTWKTLEGHWVTYSYQDEGFFWTEPALLGTLVSSRHGLFLWSPVLFFALLGLCRRMREPLVWCWSLGALLLWYANSAWHCWWFGDAFGARAFLELSGLFGVGLGLLFDSLKNSPRMAAATATLAISCNMILMVLYITGRIPASDYWLPW